jgi:hypothetical protein
MAMMPMNFVEKSKDVTSLALKTLPTGLSIAYSNLYKAIKCGEMMTITMVLNRTTAYASANSFNFINENFRPKSTVYAMGFSLTGGYKPVIARVNPDGTASFIFPNYTDVEMAVSLTYPIA